MAPGLNLPSPKVVEADNSPVASTSAPRKATVEDVDDVTDASTNIPSSSSSSKHPRFATGGIIHPPPAIQHVIDQTARLIAKKGIIFEERIKGDERANTKFAFLNDADVFNAYYRAKIEAFRDGTGPLAGKDTATQAAGDSSSTIQGPGDGQLVPGPGQEAIDDDQSEAQRPTEPRPDLFSLDLPNISAVDLDVIKLTAFFVAKKGKSFARDLLEKERNSNQFQFMRPQHSLFGLYSRIIEQYRTVLFPPHDLMQHLTISAGQHKDKLGAGAGGARQFVLEQAKQRAQWEKWMDQKRKEKLDREEQEHAAFAEIDWQDFVVVATVEFAEADDHVDLPVPMSLREVENMTIAQKKMAAMIQEEQDADPTDAIDAAAGLLEPPPRVAQTHPKERTVVDGEDEMDMDSDVEEASQKPGPAVGSQPQPSAAMKIRKDYVPKSLAERQREAAQQSTKCPVCGEMVPTKEMDEHVRIELLNPQYRQQRADIESRRAQQAALATGADPSRFLKQFAGARTDIFGLQDQEISAAKREEEERQRAKQKEKVIWDGHAASRGRTRDDFNRSDVVESNLRDIQGKFQPRDTESIGPQIGQRPTLASEQAPPVDTSGIKRPAEEHPGQPAPQRPAYETSSGPMQPAQPQGLPPHMYYQHLQPFSPDGMGGQAQPAPASASSATTITLKLPDSQSVEYAELPPTATIASIRDRIQAEHFPTTGASRIKLKSVRTGKMLNLKMTLQSAGLLERGEEIEVSVK